MGGGTLDLTWMSITDGSVSKYVSGGDNRCGGQDVDLILRDYVLKTYFEGNNKNHMNSEELLLNLCKKAKETLSEESEATFEYRGKAVTITRRTLDHLVIPVLDKIRKAVTDILTNINDNIDEVVLVGGSTRMPVVRRFLRDVLAFDDNKDLCTSISPEEAIAEGLAIRGAVLMGYDVGYLQSVLMLDTLPASLGLLLHDEKIPVQNDFKDEMNKWQHYSLKDSNVFHTVIEKGAKLPCSGALTFNVDDEALKQKFVTLSIYEDISGSKNEETVDLKLLANDDFLLPLNSHVESSVPPRVTIEFKVSCEGKLQIKLHMGDKVIDDDQPNSTYDDDKEVMQIWVLYLFLAVTALMYFFIKLHLPALSISDSESM